MEIYRWVIEHSTMLGLIIDFLALLATVFLTIAIYLLEQRHEKEQKKAEEKAQELAIVEAAKVFLIDNDDEIEYLPLAAIAAKLRLKRKHCRNLITRYLRCNEKQQQEILRLADIPEIQVSMDGVETALRDLQADLAKLNLGKNILYDGAKYFHRASKRWADVRVDNVNPCTFDNSIKKSISCEKQSELLRFQDHNITLSDYMRYYLCAENSDIDRDKFVPPINMVLQKYNLGTCDESIMTFWTMRIIIDVCKTIKEPPSTDIFDEYLIQTQEDMYYYTLAVLHDTYAVREQKNE